MKRQRSRENRRARSTVLLPGSQRTWAQSDLAMASQLMREREALWTMTKRWGQADRKRELEGR